MSIDPAELHVEPPFFLLQFKVPWYKEVECGFDEQVDPVVLGPMSHKERRHDHICKA